MKSRENRFGTAPRFALALGLALTTPYGVGHAQATRDEAQYLREEQRQRAEQERLARPAPAVAGTSTANADDGDPANVEEPGKSFPIRRIVVAGDTVLGESERQRLLAPFAGLPLGERRIDLLLRRITAAYLDRGYLTTRAYLGEQNLASGELIVTVVPGTIERIDVDGSAAGAASLSAFPGSAGEPLRLADIEQSVDQINRLRSRQAEARILPGQSPGASVLAIDTHAEKAWRVLLGTDNYGQRATGDQRQRAGVEFDNLLGAWDAWSLQQIYSAHSQTSLFAFSLPVGYGTFSTSWAQSASRVMVTESLASRTEAQSQTFGWNQVVFRNRFARLALDATVAVRESRRKLNNLALAPQDNATGRLAANLLLRGERGALSAEFGYSRGLQEFGGDGDIAGLPRSSPHNEFEKWDASLAASWSILSSLAWRGTLSGQASRTGLPGHEQLFLGGNASVRGFKEGVLAADSGLVTRNELLLTGLVPAGSAPNARVEPFVFLDASQSRLLSENGTRRLVSVGAGIRAAWRGVSADLAWGKPQAAPDSISRSGWLHAALNLQF